jgi:hypothetical protein
LWDVRRPIWTSGPPMQTPAISSTAKARAARVMTGRNTCLLPTSLPMRPLITVEGFAMLKKNGRLSVGGEMSASISFFTRGPGPPGCTMSAKGNSFMSSSGVSTGVNFIRSAVDSILSSTSFENGSGLTMTVPTVAP